MLVLVMTAPGHDARDPQTNPCVGKMHEAQKGITTYVHSQAKVKGKGQWSDIWSRSSDDGSGGLH